MRAFHVQKQNNQHLGNYSGFHTTQELYLEKAEVYIARFSVGAWLEFEVENQEEVLRCCTSPTATFR